MLDNLKSQEESPQNESRNEETLSIIATGVTSLKSKLVNMTNKNRKLWRGKLTSSATDSSPNVASGYNLRSTPTRVAQRQLVESSDSGISLEQSSPFATPRRSRDVSTLTQVVQKKEIEEVEEGKRDSEDESKDATKSDSKNESKDAATKQDSDSTGRLAPTVTLSVSEVKQARDLAEQLMSILGNFHPKQTSPSNKDPDLTP